MGAADQNIIMISEDHVTLKTRKDDENTAADHINKLYFKTYSNRKIVTIVIIIVFQGSRLTFCTGCTGAPNFFS